MDRKTVRAVITEVNKLHTQLQEAVALLEAEAEKACRCEDPEDPCSPCLARGRLQA